MRKIFLIVLTSCVLITLSSCGYKEGVIQPSDKSYLVFTGNTQNIQIIIDNSDPFSAQTSVESGSVKHYQISPGKHMIVIKKGNEIVLQREILVGSGMTKEIQVP
jgi:hypothetical protein